MHGMYGCCDHKCLAVKEIVVGLLILLNAFVWPQWLGIDGWLKFFAVLFVLGGLLMLFCPKCNCCSSGTCETSNSKDKKGKKK